MYVEVIPLSLAFCSPLAITLKKCSVLEGAFINLKPDSHRK